MRILLAIVMSLGLSFSGKADPGDTWPWGAELPFPWKGIQGTWYVKVGNQVIYFSFRTVQSTKGTNQLEIIQYNGKTCQVMADGGGFEEGRVVRGMILNGKAAKNITIHVFSEAALKYGREDAVEARKTKTYTVLNISGLNDEESEAYELHKIHGSPTGICSQKKRHETAVEP